MFRKGGTTGGGIMDNIVERGQYAESNAGDFKNLSITDKINLVESLGGSDKGLGDPLTQFLLQVGPNIATQTGGGGIIPNILGAAKEPIADLISAQRAKKKTRQAIGLEFIKDLSDSDKIALQEKIDYLVNTEKLSREEALNRVLPEFRKSKSPVDIERDEQSTKIQDIIDVTSTRLGPTLTTNQANLIFNDEIQLSKANPEAYNRFLRTSSKDKYVYKNDEYEGDINSEAGATLKEESILGSLPENTYVYDITTGNFIYRQGKRVLKLDLDIQEG